jgi:NADH dehydrogenase
MTEVITVFGGTGFLGRRLVWALLARGVTVRVAVRHPAKADFPDAGDRLQPIAADITEPASVQAAIRGAGAVANAVALYVEHGGATFRTVHFDSARRVAEVAAAEGAARLLHISGIGSDPKAASPYVRFRGLGEVAVREAFPEATVFRPSVIVGAGDAFLTTLSRLVRHVPVLPLFGTGGTRLQPAAVGDVAEAAATALVGPDRRPGVHELGGPQVQTYRELVELVVRHYSRRSLLLPVPFLVWEGLAAASRILPAPPLTEGQVALMKRDNVADPALPGLESLGVTPTPVAEVLRRDFPAGRAGFG